jgi:outer membrane receptor for ferric coprogen and ferric-rhodotorulic acid
LNMVYDARTPESETRERNAFAVHQGRFWDGKLHTLAGIFYYDYRNENVVNNVPTVVENEGSNPQLGAVYSLNKWASVYAVDAESIQGQSQRNSYGEVLPPFMGTNYEAGVKVESPDGRYSGTASFFYTKYFNRNFTDPTVPDINGNPGERVASGEDRSRGLDTEFILTLKPNWQIIAGYAYLDTEVVEDRGDQPWKVGQRFNNHAFHNYSLWTRYRFEKDGLKGLSIGGGIRGDSGAIREYRLVDGVYQPAEETTQPYLEMFLSYECALGKGQFFASLNIKNVTEQESYQFFKDNSTEPYFVWNNPREYYLRVGVRF